MAWIKPSKKDMAVTFSYSAHWHHGRAIHALAVAAISAAVTTAAAREAPAARERLEAEAAAQEAAAAREARAVQEAVAKKAAEVKALEKALAQEDTKGGRGHRDRATEGGGGEGQDRGGVQGRRPGCSSSWSGRLLVPRRMPRGLPRR